ncbi:23S rRNA (uracil(1939)-C(5))-methyltransferase RlmD [Mycoplasma sp. 4404]|uniref:23S rRNA (uracil(1939)-C(5))-methyltransferase RlmD n=1 Tax=Mycoplasma sp. 4404 TaxID=3108530 RepID=UPI002B1D7129|nr:23S rRNA (uracil(1939)-C(5))-methyltransferase RlmD [Mycoplasma sp. 4404]MEA4162596.1 23S rRNA (uracil(1939)-C(5))-methyltransferase RlmD [Mycoplasma sp. 4404]
MSKINKYTLHQELKVRCSEISYEGYGVYRDENNFPIFISDLLPNEEAIVKITNLYKNYAFGSVVQYLTLSDDRNSEFQWTPSSPLVTLKYPAQIEFKNNYFYNLLKRNLQNINVDEIYSQFTQSPIQFQYRNKVSYKLSVQNNQLTINEINQKSNEITDANNLFLVKSIIKETISQILDIIKTFLENTNKLKNLKMFEKITLRANSQNQVDVCLSIHSDYDLPAKLIKLLNEITQVVSLSINKKHSLQVLFEKEQFKMQLNDKEYICSIQSFFQVNDIVASMMFHKIKEYVNSKNNVKTILDAYCGVGTIGQIVTNKNNYVYGSDIVSSAIENANNNKLLNSVSGEYKTMSSDVYFTKNVSNLEDSILILDPPRSGISKEFINWIIAKQIKNIVYMSCDVKTLIRDLQLILEANSYKITYIQGFDMFPNTPHIEALVFIEKK